MNIQLNLSTIPQRCIQAANVIIFYILDKIKAVWKLVFGSEESQLQMPNHPIPNPYPLANKTADWPNYLDKRLGVGDDNDEIQAIANQADPHELVTPLHAAAMRNDITATFRLLAHMDANIRDYRGQTPAYWAAYYGHVQILTILKNFDADLDHLDKRGKSPLRAAVKYNRIEAIDFLVSHGADIHVKDGRGLSLIQLAAYRGHNKAYERLLFYGADEMEVDSNGMTAKKVLNQRCKEKYDNKIYLFKIFSSPTPSFSLKPYNIEKLAAKVKI